MFNQIQLAYSATATNAPPAELEADMGAVPLYSSATQDPVLGQLFGRTVESDVMSILGDVVTPRASHPQRRAPRWKRHGWQQGQPS